MGRDKAFVAVDGAPMVVRVAAALRGAGASEIFAVGGDLARLEAAGLDARADSHPGEGPLAGILAALETAAHDPVVVLSCDVPSIDATVIAAVLEALAGDTPSVEADVAAIVHDGITEPLVAAYRRRARHALSMAFDAGERAPRRAFLRLRVREVSIADAWRVRSVNTPEDVTTAGGPQITSP